MCATGEQDNWDLPHRLIAVRVLTCGEGSKFKRFLNRHACGMDHFIGRIG